MSGPVRHRLPRYLVASAVALSCDSLTLLSLVHAGILSAGLAGAVSYGLGIGVHYVLSRKFVFEPGWLHHRELAELAGFVASGLAGMALTVAILQVGSELHDLPVMLSKALAVGGSFVLTYLLRRRLVFKR